MTAGDRVHAPTRTWLASLLRDSFLAGAAEFVNRAFIFAVAIIASGILADKSVFGAFSAVALAAQLVYAFASLGVATTAVRAIAAARESSAAGLGATIRTLLLVVVAIAGSGWLVLNVFAGELVETVVDAELVALAGVLVFAQVVYSGCEAVVRGQSRFRLLPVVALVGTITAIALAPGWIEARGAAGAVLALITCFALQAVLLATSFAGQLLGPLLSLAALRGYLGRLALPYVLSGASFTLAMLYPPLLLATRGADGLEQVGAWNAASQLRVFVSFVPQVVALAAVPRLTALAERGALGARNTGAFLALVTAAALVPFVPAWWFAEPLMRLYGPEFGVDAPLLVLVCAFTIPQVVTNGCSAVLVATGRLWAAAWIQVAWCGVVLWRAPAVVDAGGATGLAGLYLWSALPVLVALGVLVALAVRPIRTGSR